MPKFLASFDRFSNCWPAASKAPSVKEETVMQNYVKAIPILGGFLCQHMLLLNHWCFCLWGKGTWTAGVSSGRLSFQHVMYDGWKVGSLRISTSLASEWKSLSDTLVSRITTFDVKDSKVSSMWGKAHRASEYDMYIDMSNVWCPSIYHAREPFDASISDCCDGVIIKQLSTKGVRGWNHLSNPQTNGEGYTEGPNQIELHSLEGGACWTIRFMVKFMADWLWLSFTHPKKQQYSTSAVHSGNGRRTRVRLPARRTVTAWRLRIPKRAQRQKLSERKEQFMANGWPS